MGATGVEKESKWIPKLGLKKADVEAALKEIGKDPDYLVPPSAKIRAAEAEVAKVLSELCPRETKFPNLFHSVGPAGGRRLWRRR